MTNAITLSICIPIYNVASYIERCARSLFEQTLQEGIEFIFVDDASPDASMAKLHALLAHYPHRQAQVTCLRHDTNQGLVATRRTALNAARGTYVIHCDSDDWVDPDYYEKMLHLAQRENADLVYSAYLKDDGAGTQTLVPIAATNDPKHLLRIILGNNRHWNVVAKLVRRDLALSPNLHIRDNACFGEDLMLSSQFIAHANRVAYCSDTYYHYYCKNDTSYTRTFSRTSLDQLISVIATLESCLPQGTDLIGCKGEVLFKALFYHLMTAREFRAYAKGIKGRVLKTASLSKIKRLLLSFAFISYPLAAWGCRLLRALR